VSNRDHVRGNRGPRRNELPTFSRLASNVPQDVLDEARQIIYANALRNDLKTERYEISVDCPLPDLFSQTYRQVLLQEKTPDTDAYDEANYTVWDNDCDKIRNYLESTFGKVNRTRVSILPPGEELDWHIDTDTSVMCRIQICVEAGDAEFQFNRKNTIESFVMSPGEMWFVNVGWNHRVINPSSDKHRISIVAGVLYEDLKALL